MVLCSIIIESGPERVSEGSDRLKLGTILVRFRFPISDVPLFTCWRRHELSVSSSVLRYTVETLLFLQLS